MEIGIGPTGLSSGWRALNGRSVCGQANSKGIQKVMLMTALALAPALLHASDLILDLPVLVTTDTQLGAAVFRSGRGELVVKDVGAPIGAGRWRLESVGTDSAMLSIVDRDDPESSTRARVYAERSGQSPVIIRIRPPEQPPTPRLVLQTAKMQRSDVNDESSPEKLP